MSGPLQLSRRSLPLGLWAAGATVMDAFPSREPALCRHHLSSGAGARCGGGSGRDHEW